MRKEIEKNKAHGGLPEPFRLLAFSDWRVQSIEKLIAHVRELDYRLDAIVYAGDDVRRFLQNGRNLFTKLGEFAEHGVLAVIGNDDTSDCKRVLNGKNVHDLHEEPYIVDEFAFIGQEGATGDIGIVLYSEDEVNKHLENQMKVVPENKIIILVSHAPPFGILDFARRFGTRHIGSSSILNFLKKYDVALNICGHVHMYGGKTKQVENTEVLNISSQDNPDALGKLANIQFFVREDQDNIEPIIRCYFLEEEEIKKLRGIGRVRARKLISTGLNTIEKICETPIEQIAKAGIPPKYAWKARLSAKALNDDELFLIENFQRPEEPTYLDVETTPVHRFMTGTYHPKENEFKQFTVRNWNDANEKRRVGRSIYDYLKRRGKTIVTYSKYDLKFIPQKIRQSKAHYDLYYWIRRSFVLPTTDYRLSSVGGVFGYQWRNPELTGLDMPRLYRDFSESGDEEFLDLIKQHNEDDVMAMFHIVEKIEGQEFNRVKFEKSEYEHLYVETTWGGVEVEPEPERFETERQRNLRRNPVEFVKNKSSYRRILEIVGDKPVRRSKLSERLGVKRSTSVSIWVNSGQPV